MTTILIGNVGAAKASFSAHKNAVDQTGIADVTQTKVTFGTEVYDVGGYFDAATNYRWTPPAGKVRLIFGARLAGTTPATTVVYIFKNGANFRQLVNNNFVSDDMLLVVVDDDANGTDYYEAFVYMDVASGTVTVRGATTDTWFSGTML